jgi:N-acyl amino acid synthase of PEP-CTERM/exosortase system
VLPNELGDLGAAFKQYFEIVPALTEQLRKEAYRIRHRVYCEELHYEPERADGLESDEYDAHSLQCLIRAKKDGKYLGCTRLVFADPADLSKPLPFEETCAHTLDRSLVDPQKLPRKRIAEVSRLVVVSAYRNRRGEQSMLVPLNDESFGDIARPRFPYIVVGLYLGTLELASLHGIENLFVLIERRLAKHLARLGFHNRPIGGEVEHRGIRVPSVMSVSGMIAGFNFMMRPLYTEVAREVREGLRAAGPQHHHTVVTGSGV